MIVELQQTDDFRARAQGNQRHGFVSVAIAAVADGRLRILFGGHVEQLSGAVGPEAAFPGEKRQPRIGPSTEDVPAHAFEHRVAFSIAQDFSRLVSRAQKPLGEHEFLRKATGRVIRKVVAVAQAYGHRIEARGVFHRRQDSGNGLLGALRTAQQIQRFTSEPFAFLRLFARGDITNHHAVARLAFPDEKTRRGDFRRELHAVAAHQRRFAMEAACPSALFQGCL